MLGSKTFCRCVKEVRIQCIQAGKGSRFKSTRSSSSTESVSRSYVETWLGNDLKGNAGISKPHYINSNRTTSSSNPDTESENFATKVTTLQRRVRELETQLVSNPSSSSNRSPSTENSTYTNPTAMIHHGTVRSGQQVYAEGRSLVVIGSVNSGGELMADGDIHVYGRLEGRAICGLSGCTSASIFTQHFAASLIGVGSTFVICDDHAEELEGVYTGKAVYVQRGKGQAHTTAMEGTKSSLSLQVDDESIVISLI